MKNGHKMILKGIAAITLATALSACSGYNSTSIPNVPFVNLDVHKHSHDLTYTDRVCVFNGGDMVTNTGGIYRDSGRFIQKMFLKTLQQYSVDGIVDMQNNLKGVTDLVALQDASRQNSCNITAIVRPVFWVDSQITPGNVGIKVDMFDTSSLQILNSVNLNARSQYIKDMFEENSPLKPVVETYVDQLFSGKIPPKDFYL